MPILVEPDTTTAGVLTSALPGAARRSSPAPTRSTAGSTVAASTPS